MTEPEPDIMKPSTFLNVGQLSEVDQWEAGVRDQCEDTLEALKDIIRADGPQSLLAYAYLMGSGVDAERLAINLAYFMLRIANAEIEAEKDAS